MKKFFIILSTIISAIIVSAQKIEWLETTHDFGVFYEKDGNKTCTMRFVNIGEKPLTILSARASCGCTQPKYPREAIAPGDTAAIEITYMPAGRPGRFDKTVNIVSNAYNENKSKLNIKGVVVGTSATVNAHYPHNAGALRLKFQTALIEEIRKNKTKTVFIDAYNVSRDTIYPEWDNLPEYITVSSGTKFVAPGDYISFAINFSAFKCPEYGLVKNNILLYPDGKERSTPFAVEVAATVMDDFSNLTDEQRMKAPVLTANPKKLSLGIIAPPNGLNASFTITNDGKSDLIIRRIYANVPYINIKYKKTRIKPGKSIEVEVTLNPFALPQDIINTYIYIATNYPDNPLMEYRVVGDIAK
ncbi:MAG: DUF1573 domain-containing protein [Muribaculaceae bacterium]